MLGKAYYAAGYAAIGQGDYVAGEARPSRRASQLAREAGDERLEAAALQQLGWLVMAAASTSRSDERAASSPRRASSWRTESATS